MPQFLLLQSPHTLLLVVRFFNTDDLRAADATISCHKVIRRDGQISVRIDNLIRAPHRLGAVRLTALVALVAHASSCFIA